MSSIVSQASQAIQIWNETRHNPAAVINYFNQATYFKLEQHDYNKWKDLNPEFIHAYMGLVQNSDNPNFSLSLFSVDSVTDKKVVKDNWDLFEANTKKNPYTSGLVEVATIEIVTNPNEIPPLEGLMRTVQWELHKDKWMTQQEDLVQVFEIPFLDLSVLFDEEGADYIIMSPALKEQEEANTFKIDLILWGYNTNGVTWHRPMDLIRPRPPFKSPVNFQLLDYSL